MWKVFSVVLFVALFGLFSCGEEEDATQDGACSNHGTQQADLSCLCDSGYTGDICDECSYGFTGYPKCEASGDDYCNSHGIRNDSACTCFDGYAGDTCEKCDEGYDSYPDCKKSDTQECSGHGSENQSGECLCETGYAGANCDKCDNGYSGYPDCKNSSEACEGVDCNGHGECLPAIGRCSCLTGFGGEFCDRCDDGYEGYPNCWARVCEEGNERCFDKTQPQICNEKGDGWIDTAEKCPEETPCYKGICADECGRALVDRSYVGCEYWGVYLQNGGGKETNGSYALVVANPQVTEVTVTVYTAGDVQLAQEVIPAGGLYSFELGRTNVVYGAGITPDAFKLVASRPVTVTQMNPFGNVLIYSNDATLLLPTAALDKEYYTMAWPSWGRRECSPNPLNMQQCISDNDTSSLPGYITVVATEEGETKVTLTYSSFTESGSEVDAASPGDVQDYTLKQYEVLNINAAGGNCPPPVCPGFPCDGGSYCWGGDLTGSVVKADKNVAVFGGHECTYLPADKPACDHLEHQIFPLSTWGKDFVAVRTEPRGTEVDTFKILAFKANTTVTWYGGISGSVTLGDGQSHEIYSNEDFIITSDTPILVGQFLASEQAGAGTGDPAMMLLAPTEQLRSSYIFLVPPNYDNNTITIVAPKGVEVKIDDVNLDSSTFVEIGSSGWMRLREPIDAGAHVLTATGRVGLYVYGFSSYVSYAYTAGLDLKSINDQR